MVLLLALALGQGLDLNRDAIVGEKLAYIMLLPDVVCGGNVDTLAWSPDGKTLGLVRHTNTVTEESIRQSLLDEDIPKPQPMTEIWLWNQQSRTGRAVFRAKEEDLHIEQFEWLGNSALAASVQANREDVFAKELWLIKNTGITNVPVPAPEWRRIEVSPTHDVAAILYGNQAASAIRFFDSSGRLSPMLDVGQPIRAIDWVQGRAAMPIYKNVNGRLRHAGWMFIDRRTGALSPAKDVDLRLEVPSPALDTDSHSYSIDLKGKTARGYAVSVAEPQTKQDSDNRAGLVSSDAAFATVAPGNRAIAYVSQGVAMVRKLVPVPKSAYEKAAVVEGAKQVGLALVMYSMDADDLFPPNEGWRDITMPYIKDMGLLNSFVYTFPGGKLAEGADPAKQQIGYMSGPGGRATVYADGSVKWQR
jgi:hypothetical protein